MNYQDFKKTVCDHLSLPFNDDVINGIWWINKKENKKTRVPHILRMKDYNSKGEQRNEQERVVREYNLLKIISQTSSKFLLKGKLHQFAHHLNSSQIMCYNFFRPQIDDDKKVEEPLIKFLRDIGVTLNEYHEESEAYFEYIDKESKEPKRKTNFDFFIKIGETKVYFEIKYTENGFGSCKNDPEHQKKFHYYEDEMKKCGIFKERVNDKGTTMCKYYQLIRNAVKVRDHSFVVIITDERNNSTKDDLDAFETEMLKDTKYRKCHFIRITWQKLCDKAPNYGFSETHIKQFREKYYLSD